MGIRREEKFIQIKSVIQEVKSNCRHGRLDSWEIDYVARKHTFLASFRKFFLSSITDVTRKKKKSNLLRKIVYSILSRKNLKY